VIKKRQHYVWRHYLRAWSKKDMIYCMRKNKVFKSSLMNIAHEKYFYKLQELTSKEKDLIRKLAIEKSPAFLKPLHENFLRNFTIVFNLRNFAKKNNTYTLEIEKETKKLITNLEEDYQSAIENSGQKYLKLILQKKIDFFENQDSRNEFAYYLTTQYMRTKQIRSSVQRSVGNNQLVDITKIWPILAHIFATNMGHRIAASKDFKIVLLQNQSQSNFITGDQPVINTFVYDKGTDEEVFDLEFYYPISNKFAILVTLKTEFDSIQTITNNDEVKHYNNMIFKSSEEQIYANSELELEDYKYV